LLVRTEGDQRRTDQPLADMAEAAGTAGAGILLLEDDLLGDGEPAPAMRFRPAGAGPAARGELALPFLAQVREGFAVAGMAAVLQDGEAAGEMRRHPGGDLGAECVDAAHAASP